MRSQPPAVAWILALALAGPASARGAESPAVAGADALPPRAAGEPVVVLWPAGTGDGSETGGDLRNDGSTPVTVEALGARGWHTLQVAAGATLALPSVEFVTLRLGEREHTVRLLPGVRVRIRVSAEGDVRVSPALDGTRAETAPPFQFYLFNRSAEPVAFRRWDTDASAEGRVAPGALEVVSAAALGVRADGWTRRPQPGARTCDDASLRRFLAERAPAERAERLRWDAFVHALLDSGASVTVFGADCPAPPPPLVLGPLVLGPLVTDQVGGEGRFAAVLASAAPIPLNVLVGDGKVWFLVRVAPSGNETIYYPQVRVPTGEQERGFVVRRGGRYVLRAGAGVWELVEVEDR